MSNCSRPFSLAPRRWSRIRAALAVVCVGSVPFCLVGAPAAEAASRVSVTARIDGETVRGERVGLDPGRRTRVDVEVRNLGTGPVHVASVRVSGSALGLTFFAYDTALSLDVPAGQSASQSFDVDLSDLRTQAVGLMPIDVTIRDDDRAVLSTSSGTGDVQGSLLSVFGLFGLFLAGATAMSTATALLALARHRLPANRWRRALRFLPPGIGVGLTAVITLSVLRVTPPVTQAEVPLVLATGAIGFLLGYFTPSPDDDDPAGPHPDVNPAVVQFGGSPDTRSTVPFGGQPGAQPPGLFSGSPAGQPSTGQVPGWSTPGGPRP